MDPENTHKEVVSKYDCMVVGANLRVTNPILKILSLRESDTIKEFSAVKSDSICKSNQRLGVNTQP